MKKYTIIAWCDDTVSVQHVYCEDDGTAQVRAQKELRLIKNWTIKEDFAPEWKVIAGWVDLHVLTRTS